jgi:transcriptional regulator with XRE-family HTH domain
MENNKIGKRIKHYREAAGLSQERLAEATELSTNFISYIERGIRQPSLENFINIANALNISSDILLYDVLINPKQQEQLSDYMSRIEKLPPKEKQRIIAVLEAMLSEF